MRTMRTNAALGISLPGEVVVSLDAEQGGHHQLLISSGASNSSLKTLWMGKVHYSTAVVPIGSWNILDILAQPERTCFSSPSRLAGSQTHWSWS